MGDASLLYREGLARGLLGGASKEQGVEGVWGACKEGRALLNHQCMRNERYHHRAGQRSGRSQAEGGPRHGRTRAWQAFRQVDEQGTEARGRAPPIQAHHAP